MASIKEEIAAIAVEHGYTGPKPKSTAGAIDALADTLAGEDVKSGRSIAGAIHALAPYIGAGGGDAERVELFNETVETVASQYGNMATLAYTGDIGGSTLPVTFDGVEYVLPKTQYGYGATYGTDGYDFSTYPLSVEFNPDTNSWDVLTEDAGEHTIVAYQTTVALGATQTLTLGFSGTGVTIAAWVYVSSTPFDISTDDVTAIESHADVATFAITSDDGGPRVYGGSYIAVLSDNVELTPTVDEVPMTDGYEVRTIDGTHVLTTRVPQGPARHTLGLVESSS